MPAVLYVGTSSCPTATPLLPIKAVNMSILSLINRTLTGVISGTVTENGVAVYRAQVHLYDRTSGERVCSALTDVSGAYSFTGLDQANTGNFFVAAMDPAGGVQYDAIVHDRVPVA